MRVMVLRKSDQNTETGVLPDEKLLAAMGKNNDDLRKAGVLLWLAQGLLAAFVAYGRSRPAPHRGPSLPSVLQPAG